MNLRGSAVYTPQIAEMISPHILPAFTSTEPHALTSAQRETLVLLLGGKIVMLLYVIADSS